jgi:UDP-N-acetylglucosamine 1-carboxyvinyltransferase
MGAKIDRGRHLNDHRRGRRALSAARHHAVLPDRIETGTYAMAVAMTGGDVLLEGARETHLLDRRRWTP